MEVKPPGEKVLEALVHIAQAPRPVKSQAIDSHVLTYLASRGFVTVSDSGVQLSEEYGRSLYKVVLGSLKTYLGLYD